MEYAIIKKGFIRDASGQWYNMKNISTLFTDYSFNDVAGEDECIICAKYKDEEGDIHKLELTGFFDCPIEAEAYLDNIFLD